MRFAPPQAMRIADRSGGLNQTSVRTYNERLVMSLLRQHERLSRMEIGQLSGLSAQTVSVIVRALERDNLILRGEAQRGRVGPPSIPMSLNPDGAFGIGIKIGPSSCDAVLLDFVGTVRADKALEYAVPAPEAVFDFVAGAVAEFGRALPGEPRPRIVGAGLALPEAVENWAPTAGAPWAKIDFEAWLVKIADLPTYVQNDVTAAAGAEAVFGPARALRDFLYFFVGVETSSRLVLDHRIYAGRRGGNGVRIAALAELQARVAASGADPADVWYAGDTRPDLSGIVEQWTADCAAGLVEAIASISAFVHIGTVIIDGRMPAEIGARLREAVVEGLSQAGPADGLPEVVAGWAGGLAKAIGAAVLPVQARFMVQDVGLAGPDDDRSITR